MSLPTFLPLDRRIRHYELVLETELTEQPVPPLPEGYCFSFYEPGDRENWLRIEKSAGEFETDEQGHAAWERFFASHEAELPDRMLFVADPSGRKVATASAYFDVTGRDRSGAGWLHWVAVEASAQGKGLSRPLIARALNQLQALGYTQAKVPTQTTSWLACKLYLDFGFRPIPQNAVHSRDGWRIMRRLTDHPALADFPPAEDILVLAQGTNY
ncbi:MAG: GNAT family N-acetyltransferase [Clostridia bacterium]|nr:GNAT family N-acetyltransferase [Clostridia bacterium]